MSGVDSRVWAAGRSLKFKSWRPQCSSTSVVCRRRRRRSPSLKSVRAGLLFFSEAMDAKLTLSPATRTDLCTRRWRVQLGRSCIVHFVPGEPSATARRGPREALVVLASPAQSLRIVAVHHFHILFGRLDGHHAVQHFLSRPTHAVARWGVKKCMARYEHRTTAFLGLGGHTRLSRGYFRWTDTSVAWLL